MVLVKRYLLAVLPLWFWIAAVWVRERTGFSKSDFIE